MAMDMSIVFSSDGAERLAAAAASGDLVLARKLLAVGFAGEELVQGDLDAIVHRRSDLLGRTALHQAAASSSADGAQLVKLILDDKRLRSPDTLTAEGLSALQLAARSGVTASVAALVSSLRVDPNRRDRLGRTPLHYALRSRNHGALSALLASPRVDVNLQCERGCTPLMTAIELGCEVGVARLLAAAPPRVPPSLSCRPLSARPARRPPTPKSRPSSSSGVYNRAPSSIVPAATRTCKVNLPNADGWTPLHVAVGCNTRSGSCAHSILARLLADGRVDVLERAKCSPHWTALHLAAAKGAALSVARLLAHPLVASEGLSLQDENGATPLDLARRRRHTALAALILRATARMQGGGTGALLVVPVERARADEWPELSSCPTRPSSACPALTFAVPDPNASISLLHPPTRSLQPVRWRQSPRASPSRQGPSSFVQTAPHAHVHRESTPGEEAGAHQ
jgi:ankyrin repeat protein